MDPVHLTHKAYRDLWLRIKLAAEAKRGGENKLAGGLHYKPIVNNIVEHRLASSQTATAQWLLGTAAAGSSSDSWSGRSCRNGSVSS